MTKALGFILLRVIDTVSSLGNNSSTAGWYETPAREEGSQAAPVPQRMRGPFCGKIRRRPT